MTPNKKLNRLKNTRCFTVMITLCLVMATLFAVVGCDKSETPTERCNVNNPLTDLPWLKEFCESLNEPQDFDSVRIHLYKVIDKEEYLFQISFSYSSFENSPFLYSADWKSCVGELVFHVNAGVPPNPEVLGNFMKDKEYVAELLHFIKQ